MRSVLELLEEAPADERLAGLAYLAGRGVVLDEDELRGSARRSLQLLAAGGDPRRPLEPDGRAVTALAADLDDPAARDALARGLEALLAQADGLPEVEGCLRQLVADPALAWRGYACAVLAEALGGD